MRVRENHKRTLTDSQALLYRSVAMKLRKRIARETYPPGCKLPSINDLVGEFGVSSISVRRALRDLTYEGLIYTEQGRGAFVRQKGIIHRVIATDPNCSIGDEIERAGFIPTIADLGRDRIKADSEISGRLQIKPTTRIWRHHKLVLADAEPISLHYLYYTADLAERLKPYLSTTFVFSMLQHARLHPVKTRFEFGADTLKTADTALFKLPAGSPMGVLCFTPIAKSGKPILTGITLFRSDRVVFELDVPK